MKVYNVFKSTVFTLTTIMLFSLLGIIFSIMEANPMYGMLLDGTVSVGVKN